MVPMHAHFPMNRPTESVFHRQRSLPYRRPSWNSRTPTKWPRRSIAVVTFSRWICFGYPPTRNSTCKWQSSPLPPRTFLFLSRWKYPTMVDLIELEFDSIVLACNCVRRRKSTSTSVTKKLTHSASFLGSWLPSMISSASKFPPTLTSNDLIEHFVHLLIILTSQDILIYTIDDQSANNVQRWYTTPTLKYTLNQIGYFDSLATSNERFFLGGQCGDIYEFTYEENLKSTLNKLGQTFLSNLVPSFLQLGSSSSHGTASSTTVKQITIDHQRLLLYARLANDSLQIYDISTEKGHRLFSYTFDELISKLKQRQTISYDDYRPFLTMYTVQGYESNLFNLILVTHTGIRLYYALIMPTGRSLITLFRNSILHELLLFLWVQLNQQPMPIKQRVWSWCMFGTRRPFRTSLRTTLNRRSSELVTSIWTVSFCSRPIPTGRKPSAEWFCWSTRIPPCSHRRPCSRRTSMIQLSISNNSHSSNNNFNNVHWPMFNRSYSTSCFWFKNRSRC